MLLQIEIPKLEKPKLAVPEIRTEPEPETAKYERGAKKAAPTPKVRSNARYASCFLKTPIIYKH